MEVIISTEQEGAHERMSAIYKALHHHGGTRMMPDGGLGPGNLYLNAAASAEGTGDVANLALESEDDLAYSRSIRVAIEAGGSGITIGETCNCFRLDLLSTSGIKRVGEIVNESFGVTRIRGSFEIDFDLWGREKPVGDLVAYTLDRLEALLTDIKSDEFQPAPKNQPAPPFQEESDIDHFLPPPDPFETIEEPPPFIDWSGIRSKIRQGFEWLGNRRKKKD